MVNGTINEETAEITPINTEVTPNLAPKEKRGNPIGRIPKKYTEKGHPGMGGRPKKTEEQKRREREQKQFEEALRGIKLENIAVFKELQKNKAYMDIFLRTLESGARNGNPSTLKFMNEIIGNVIEKETQRAEPKIEIKILHQFS